MSLLVCLVPLLAWADSLSSPPRLGEYASPDQRFRLQVISYENSASPEQSSTPGGGTLEVTSRREPIHLRTMKTFGSTPSDEVSDEPPPPRWEITTTREKNARRQLVAMKLEARIIPAGGSELRLSDTQAGQNAPPLWRLHLDYTPNWALVSPSGRYVATFDHWNRKGNTPDVVVLYGPEGKRVCRLALEDFLSWFERVRLPQSSSSTHWAGTTGTPGHRFDEEEGVLILQVVASNRPPFYAQQYFEKRISLATGEVL